MIQSRFFLCLFFSFCVAFLQLTVTPARSLNFGSIHSSDTTGTVYNAELAEELGADNYGMHRYVIAFLKSGTTPSPDSETAMELQRAHLDNIRRMAQEGDLVLAGPFLDNGEIRGIYVFDVQTVEEARALTETDPAIQAGTLEMELRPWYGSAALMIVNEIHAQISKENP